jgi:hypothetical protein
MAGDHRHAGGDIKEAGAVQARRFVERLSAAPDDNSSQRVHIEPTSSSEARHGQRAPVLWLRGIARGHGR